MNLREYQAKNIFTKYDILVPAGDVAQNPEQVKQIVTELNKPVVLKPQLGVKKRGKLGIIKFADDPESAARESESLFGLKIKNELIKTILVESKAAIQQELYLAVTIDYGLRCPVIIISRRGGVDIEELAKSEPRQILKIPVDILNGITNENLATIADFADENVAEIAKKLYAIFRDYDADLTEINPLIKTSTDDLIAVDAVLNINEDSLFRHPEVLPYRQEFGDLDPIAEEARENSWTYIDLPGDIAILSSGAGLTMTILDLINFAGGAAANFIDTAQIDEDGVYSAFKLLSKAKPAKALLINIFAGLNRCDSLAKGISRYLKDYPLEIPLVVRMVGNKEIEGHKILRDIGVEPFSKLEDAIERVVELSKGQG